MHKLLCATLCLATSFVFADNLLDAIRKHDLKEVALLLQQKAFNPYNYNQYLAAATEAVQISREKLLLQEVKPKADPVLSLLGITSLLVGLGSWLSISVMVLQPDFDYSNQNIIYDSIKSRLYISGGSYLTAFILLGIGIGKHTSDLKKTYDNALKIQDLIIGLNQIH